MIKIPTLFKRTFDDTVLSLEDNSLKDTMRNTVNLFRKML